MSYGVKQPLGTIVGYQALKMVKVLAKAGTKGVAANRMPYTTQQRINAANWLRQVGVLVHCSKGNQARWYLLRDNAADVPFARNVVRAMMKAHYVETCRKHMAIAKHPEYAEVANLLASHAVAMGSALGIPVGLTVENLKPTELTPQWAQPLMDAGALPQK